MNIETLIYLSDVLPNFSKGIGILSTICLLAMGMAGTVMAVESASSGLDSKDRIKIYGYPKILIIPLLGLLITGFIPSQKTIYLIMGSHYLKDSSIPKKIELLLNKKLDEYLTEEKK